MKTTLCPCCAKKMMPLQVLCHDHWSMVPDELRQAVSQAKKHRGSPQWDKAVKAAVDFIHGTIALKREHEQWAYNFGDRY